MLRKILVSALPAAMCETKRQNMKRITYAILKHLVHVKHISIPNMLTNRQVYPELLCEAASPENIVQELGRYLYDEANKRGAECVLTT